MRMSRGIGRLQQSIIREVEGIGERATTFETLRWTLWKCTPSPNGNLLQSWNTSLYRAVKVLADRGNLNINRRPLANLDEWVMHYPGKSLSIQIHDLREELLPHIVTWLREGDGPQAKFSKAENEEFAASRLAPNQAQALRSLWGKLDPCLREYYGKTGKDNPFQLLVRGKQLFTHGGRVSTSESFVDLVTAAAADQGMPEALREGLQLIMSKLLPGTYGKTLEFKSYIRAIAREIPTSGHCCLSEKAEDALFERCPERLSQLSGFEPAPTSKGRGMLESLEWEIRRNRPKHSQVLKKILDHSVFQHFRFLTA